MRGRSSDTLRVPLADKDVSLGICGEWSDPVVIEQSSRPLGGRCEFRSRKRRMEHAR